MANIRQSGSCAGDFFIRAGQAGGGHSDLQGVTRIALTIGYRRYGHNDYRRSTNEFYLILREKKNNRFSLDSK